MMKCLFSTVFSSLEWHEPLTILTWKHGRTLLNKNNQPSFTKSTLIKHNSCHAGLKKYNWFFLLLYALLLMEISVISIRARYFFHCQQKAGSIFRWSVSRTIHKNNKMRHINVSYFHLLTIQYINNWCVCSKTTESCLKHWQSRFLHWNFHQLRWNIYMLVRLFHLFYVY